MIKLTSFVKIKLNKKHESIIVRNADMCYKEYDIENNIQRYNFT